MKKNIFSGGIRNMKYKELVEEWLEEKKHYVKESTYALYTYEMRSYILPMLGEIELADITEEVLQDCTLQWQKMPLNDGKPRNNSVIQNWIVLVKQTLNYAVRKGYLAQFKMHIYISPNKKRKTNLEEEYIFTPAEQQKIIHYAATTLTPQVVGIALCLSSGLRIGEICALQWKDIDTENQVIYITKTIQRIYNKESMPHTKVVITTPKSSSSIRVIPLSSSICQLIRDIQDCGIDGDLYFLSSTNVPFEPRKYRRNYEKILNRLEIPYRNFHCLRHTFATRCVENGGDYKCVSEILGHSSIKITMDRYVHPRMEQKREIVEMLP